jgi:hypothetical protein
MEVEIYTIQHKIKTKKNDQQGPHKKLGVNPVDSEG